MKTTNSVLKQIHIDFCDNFENLFSLSINDITVSQVQEFTDKHSDIFKLYEMVVVGVFEPPSNQTYWYKFIWDSVSSLY